MSYEGAICSSKASIRNPILFSEDIDNASASHDVENLITAMVTPAKTLDAHKKRYGEIAEDGAMLFYLKKLIDNLDETMFDKTIVKKTLTLPDSVREYTTEERSIRTGILNNYHMVEEDLEAIYQVARTLRTIYENTPQIPEERLILARELEITSDALHILFSDKPRSIREITEKMVDASVPKIKNRIEMKGDELDTKVNPRIYGNIALNLVKNMETHGEGIYRLSARNGRLHRDGMIHLKAVNCSKKIPEKHRLGEQGYTTRDSGKGGEGIYIINGIAESCDGKIYTHVKGGDRPIFGIGVSLPKNRICAGYQLAA